MVIWPLEIILYFSIFLMKGKILCYKIVYIYVSSSNRNCAEFDVVTKKNFFLMKNHNKCKRQ